MRITAGAFGTSITTTLWDNRAALHQSRLAEATSLYSPATQQEGRRPHCMARDSTDDQTLAALTRGLVEQSFMMSSLDYILRDGGDWLLLIVGLVWLTRRPQVASGIGVAAE